MHATGRVARRRNFAKPGQFIDVKRRQIIDNLLGA